MTAAKLCRNCQRPIAVWKRQHARFCKSSCRVVYCRQRKKQGKVGKESVNSLGFFELEVAFKDDS